MDVQTGSALGLAGCISGALAAFYTYYKHSQCHSNCCGKKVDLEVDLTPVEKLAPIKVDGGSSETKKADDKRCPNCTDTKIKVSDA